MAVYDSFDRYADGTVPTVATTGQVWGQFSGPGTVTGGYYDSTEGTGASYIEVDSGLEAITTLGATFKFDTMGGTRSGNGCSLCLVSWSDGGIVAEGFGRRTSAHVVVTPVAVQWYIRDVEAGGEVTLVASRTISPALSFDTDHTIEITVDHDAHTGVAVIDGSRTFNWSDSRIVKYGDEVYACWEPYYTADGTAPRSRIKDVWAEGVETEPEPPVTTPTLVGQTAHRFTSSTTTSSVVCPAVQDGDLIIVGSSFLANSLTLSQTAGPTLTATTAVQRSGLTSRLFYRTATAADSGQTITITSSTANVGHTVLWVLRNVTWVAGSDSRTSQGSGSTTITMPAYTPASNRLPVHIIALGRGSNAAATLTPASNMTAIGPDLPISTQRTGWMLGSRFTDDAAAVGTTWTNSSDHYAATWTLALEPVAVAEVKSGSATSSVTTTAAAAGRSVRRGTDVETVSTTAAAAGRSVRRGADVETVSTTASGAGRAVRRGADTETVSTTASGAGRAVRRGADVETVAATTSAGGMTIRRGGAMASAGAAPASTGKSVRRGSGATSISAAPSAAGRKRSSRPAISTVNVAASGAGSVLQPGGGSANAAVTATTTAGGFARRRGADVETVTATTMAVGLARRRGADVETVAALAAAVGRTIRRGSAVASVGTVAVMSGRVAGDVEPAPVRPEGSGILTVEAPVYTLTVSAPARGLDMEAS